MFLILAVFFIIKGYKVGFIKQIAAITAIILGLYIAADQYIILAEFLHKKVNFNIKLLELISFAIILLIVNIIVSYIGNFLTEMLDLIFLSLVDHFGGAILGLIKGILIMYLVLLLSSNIPVEPIEKQLEESYFAGQFLKINPFLEEKISQLTG